MTNEEIRQEIQVYQNKCRQALLSNLATFELNHDIAEYKKKINALRDKCTHVNEKFEEQCENDGRCIYCGKKLHNSSI